MKDKIIDFFNTFNMDDFTNFFLNLDLLDILSRPIVVVIFVALGVLAVYQKWRLVIITILSYSLLYGYLFITFVVVKNSDLSSIPTFLLFLSSFFLITGLGIYKYFICDR